MFRHIFIAPAFAAAGGENLDFVVQTLAAIPTIIPTVLRFSVAKNAGLSGEPAGIVMVADFDSAADWQDYMQNGQHLALGEHIKPYIDLSDMTVTQYFFNQGE